MLTLNAYAFHSHPRRDTRPYIRAYVTDELRPLGPLSHSLSRVRSVPGNTKYLLEAEHDPLGWPTGFVKFPDLPAELVKPKSQFRADWLRAVCKEKKSVPGFSAGASAEQVAQAALASASSSSSNGNSLRNSNSKWGKFGKRSSSVH